MYNLVRNLLIFLIKRNNFLLRQFKYTKMRTIIITSVRLGNSDKEFTLKNTAIAIF